MSETNILNFIFIKEKLNHNHIMQSVKLPIVKA